MIHNNSSMEGNKHHSESAASGTSGSGQAFRRRHPHLPHGSDQGNWKLQTNLQASSLRASSLMRHDGAKKQVNRQSQPSRSSYDSIIRMVIQPQ